MQDDLLYLFGGDQPWDSSLWTDSDDRVRGGSSVSHLTLISPERVAFSGHLDTSTLGGAGFASQRTVGELSLDLSDYEGLLISVDHADSKKYTLTLKDTLPGRREDGRDEAGVSWEFDFVAKRDAVVSVLWKEFRATYRGRDVKDPKPLDLSDVKRVGLMMRSFFDEQKGDFELVLNWIAAKKSFEDDEDLSSDEEEDLKPNAVERSQQETAAPRPWWRILLCGLC